MLKRMIIFLVGYLRIEVSEGRIEQFLNLAVEQGISLWQIQRLPDRMRATLTVRDFRALRPVARGSGCRVRIRRRYGLPFRLVRLRRRPVLALGGIVCLAVIVWASSHIWVIRVKVTGPQNLDPRAVTKVAAEAGLRTGVAKRGIDTRQVEQHIMKRMGELSWAVVRIQGTRAVIEVVEKAVQTMPDSEECINLVARKEGIVEQVVPFQGEPMVRQGDVVRAGDLLVECSLRYWEGGRPAVLPGTEKPPREAVARTLTAQARVMAAISYRTYQEVPLLQEVQSPTGRKTTRWVLKWGDRTILLRGPDQVPFSHFKERRRHYGLGSWRNWDSPVEIVILDAEELRIRKERIPVSQAVERAKGKVDSWLKWSLGPSDKLLSPVEVEVVEQGQDYIGLRMTVQTLEDIAMPSIQTSVSEGGSQ